MNKPDRHAQVSMAAFDRLSPEQRRLFRESTWNISHRKAANLSLPDLSRAIAHTNAQETRDHYDGLKKGFRE